MPLIFGTVTTGLYSDTWYFQTLPVAIFKQLSSGITAPQFKLKRFRGLENPNKGKTTRLDTTTESFGQPWVDFVSDQRAAVSV